MIKIKQRKLRAAAEIGFSGLMLIVGVVFPLLFLKKSSDVRQIEILALELLGGAGLGLQFIIYLTKFSKRPLELYLAGFCVAVPLVLLTSLW